MNKDKVKVARQNDDFVVVTINDDKYLCRYSDNQKDGIQLDNVYLNGKEYEGSDDFKKDLSARIEQFLLIEEKYAGRNNTAQMPNITPETNTSSDPEVEVVAVKTPAGVEFNNDDDVEIAVVSEEYKVEHQHGGFLRITTPENYIYDCKYDFKGNMRSAYLLLDDKSPNYDPGLPEPDYRKLNGVINAYFQEFKPGMMNNVTVKIDPNKLPDYEIYEVEAKPLENNTEIRQPTVRISHDENGNEFMVSRADGNTLNLSCNGEQNSQYQYLINPENGELHIEVSSQNPQHLLNKQTFVPLIRNFLIKEELLDMIDLKQRGLSPFLAQEENRNTNNLINVFNEVLDESEGKNVETFRKLAKLLGIVYDKKSHDNNKPDNIGAKVKGIQKFRNIFKYIHKKQIGE